MKPHLIVIVGPTASGKSDIAVQAAELFGGEVVSADSRQVYTGLDIGTGKIMREEMRGVPHHLLNVVPAGEEFSVHQYKKLADSAIADIIARGKVPILCGGTGLYINAIVNNVVLPDVPPNPELRDKLSDKTADEMFRMLQAQDPDRAETIDPKNPRRLVRALEIAEALGSVPGMKHGPELYQPILVGVERDPEELKVRMKQRLRSRIEAGMIEEARTLHDRGLSYEAMFSLGLEYKYLAWHLQGKMTTSEMETQLYQAIVDYVKRQMTWFRKDPRIVWLTPLEITPYLTKVLTTA